MSSTNLHPNNFKDISETDKILPSLQNSSCEDLTKENHFRTQLIIKLSPRNSNQSLKDGENQRKLTGGKRINFCVDNFPERKLNRRPKVIKLKVTLPKGLLQNTDTEKRNLKTSSKLTQTDHPVNNIFMNQESADINTLTKYNENEDTFENEFVPTYKSSQIFEIVHCDSFKSQSKIPGNIYQFSMDEGETNKTVYYPPIMGKKALLAKIHATKDRLSDSEIIRKLVEERFHKFLRAYYERSSKRAERRSVRLDNDVNVAVEPPMDNCNVIERNRSESKSDGGIGSSETSSKSSILNDSVYSISSQNTEMSEVSKKNKRESRKDKDINNMCEDNSMKNLEYDAKAFLLEALGEDADMDMDSSMCGFNKTLDEMNSSFHSKYSSGNKVSVDRSIGTSELSVLLSKASSLYSSISKRMRRSATSIFRQTPINEETNRTPSIKEECFSRSNEKLAELAHESAVQHQILLQTSKALNVCKNIKEFISSREQVEAERILLTAACKREIIMEELNKLEFEDATETSTKNCGTVIISNLKFSAKRDLDEFQLQRQNKEFSQWFVCVANCGLKLFASEAVLPEENGNVCFTNTFEFDKLPPNFEIQLALYCMRIKNSARNYSHESKFHLNKNEKTTCPTPQKVLKMHKDKSRNKEEPLIRTSSFTLGGRTLLRISNLSKATPFILSNVPLSSNLDGTLTLNIASIVVIDERYSGFLNIGSESGNSVIWNRRWCSLYGQELKCWNYPCEENVTEAIIVLHLNCCANSWISTADRASCPRPKTLLLEITNILHDNVNEEPKYNIMRYFLNADSLEDMKNWENSLNAVVASLRNWNAMKNKIAFRKDVL